MIHEVDDGLRGLIRRDVLPGTETEILFDAPTTDWASRRNAPTIDIYLYDLREDMRRRTSGTIEERSQGLVSSRQRVPRFFRLSYLITAWTQRPEDEHRLLSILLAGFLSHGTIPRDLLGPGLAGGPPVGLDLALPPSEDRALSDIWSSLGGELKPSIDLVVTAPAPFMPSTDIAPPVLETPTVVVTGSDFEQEAAARSRKGRRPPEPHPDAARSTARRGGRVVTIVDRKDTDGG